MLNCFITFSSPPPLGGGGRGTVLVFIILIPCYLSSYINTVCQFYLMTSKQAKQAAR